MRPLTYTFRLQHIYHPSPIHTTHNGINRLKKMQMICLHNQNFPTWSHSDYLLLVYLWHIFLQVNQLILMILGLNIQNIWPWHKNAKWHNNWKAPTIIYSLSKSNDGCIKPGRILHVSRLKEKSWNSSTMLMFINSWPFDYGC